MGKLNKIIFAMCSVLGLCALMPGAVQAETVSGTTESGLSYTVTDEGVEITDYSGSETAVSIPSKITIDGKSYSVKEIAATCFFGNADITSVAIPMGIECIGDRAFANCSSLKSVTMPDSITGIGKWAFDGCTGLISVKMSKNLTVIPNFAFRNCSALGEVEIPGSVLSIESEAFFGCTALESVFISYQTGSIDDKALGYYQGSDSQVMRMSDLRITGYEKTAAEDYAMENMFSFIVTDRPAEGSNVMYRVYNPNNGEHFFTKNVEEKDHLVSLGWDDEGEAWTAPAYSTQPVYRLYNKNSGEHHYTMSEEEKEMLIGIGWQDEKIGWYSNDIKTTPLYRLYNPNAKGQFEAGGHHYTTNAGERDHLVTLGWRDEQIGWYGM